MRGGGSCACAHVSMVYCVYARGHEHGAPCGGLVDEDSGECGVTGGRGVSGGTTEGWAAATEARATYRASPGPSSPPGEVGGSCRAGCCRGGSCRGGARICVYGSTRRAGARGAADAWPRSLRRYTCTTRLEDGRFHLVVFEVEARVHLLQKDVDPAVVVWWRHRGGGEGPYAMHTQGDTSAGRAERHAMHCASAACTSTCTCTGTRACAAADAQWLTRSAGRWRRAEPTGHR